MTNTFKKRWVKLLMGLGVVFVLLFLFRLMYGYSKTFETTTSHAQLLDDFSSSRRNYASKKYIKSAEGSQAVTKVDQKYEKIANIKTKSAAFDEEEKVARTKIEEFNALIQFEQKRGNKGHRNLSLLIGVPPDNFDALYTELITIGKVEAKSITKKDKTNEYKQLNAEKESLEKIRASLIDLKSKGGKIDEYMNLENRILDIEQQLQGLGVSLGDFDDENEFCTVQFSLAEGKEIKIGILQRVKVALEWTVKMYLQLMVTLFFMMLLAYVVLLIIDKLKVIEKIVGGKE